MKTDFLVV
jgi:hypothetical protein